MLCELDHRIVQRAECSCPRGQYRCHHMAVVLLHAMKSLSKTDREHTRNKRKSNEEVKTVDELYPPAKSPYHACACSVNEEDKECFAQSLVGVQGGLAFAWYL